MKKSLTILVLTALLLIVNIGLVGCYSQNVLSSSPQFPIEIDGFTDDWNSYRRYSIPEFQTSYAIANNDSVLYILVLRRDLDKSIAQGVNMWFAPDGKTTNAINIRYYGTPRANIIVDKTTTLAVDEYEEKYELDNDVMRRELGGIWDLILVQSMRGDRPRLISPNGVDGPRAAFRILPGNIRAYEFAFPLKNHPQCNYKLPITSGRKFDIGFEFVSRHSMVWGDTMWEWNGRNLVKTYYWTNAPRKRELYVKHPPQWNSVLLK